MNVVTVAGESSIVVVIVDGVVVGIRIDVVAGVLACVIEVAEAAGGVMVVVAVVVADGDDVGGGSKPGRAGTL